MGSSNSKEQSSQNPTEQKASAETRQQVEEHGVRGIEEFYKVKLEGWKNVTLNFVVTGDSGSGKSAFINAIRGMKDYDEGAAKVGVTETTKKPTRYAHPSNAKVIFWDVPGFGTPDHKDIDVYRKKIDLETYDAFLIFTRGRFTHNNLKLAEEAKSIKKPFFFIRSHVETETKNDMKSKGPKYNEEERLTEMRNNCYENLQELLTSENDIFLIDNYVTNKWDFGRLITAIINVLPERRKECFILSLSNVTRDCLKRKATLLRVRAGIVGTVTAPASAIPVPGVGAFIDLAVMVNEIRNYRTQFGMPVDDSEQFESLDRELKKKLLGYGIKTAAQITADIAAKMGLEMGAEEVIKYIPAAGAIVASAMSATFTSSYLISCIDDLEKVALKVWDMTVDRHGE